MFNTKLASHVLFVHHSLWVVQVAGSHTTGAAAGVVQGAVKGLDHGSDQLNGVVGCVELPLLFCGIDGKLLEEIFVHTTNQVFLLAKRLMTDFVDLVNHLLDVIRRKVSSGKCPLGINTIRQESI